MIKFTNILNENEGSTLNLDTPVNRKILSALLKYHPELIAQQKEYYRHSTYVEYKINIIYKTIINFLRDNIGINDKDIIKEIALLFLINPNINNPKEDELFDGSDIYITLFEYANDEIYESDEEENVECYECDGYGYEECYECDGTGNEECIDCHGEGSETCSYCDGSGEIEDSYGEEGDTLVCDECDGNGNKDCDYCIGTGEMNCRECDGRGRTDCTYCEGEGDVVEEYVEFELLYHKKYFISYEPLDGIDEELTTDPIEEFVKINKDKKMFLWYDDTWTERSKNGTNDLSYDRNDFLSFYSIKLSEFELKYRL